MIGGLWPAELATTTPETAPLADYLKADLQRIANAANEELRNIRLLGLGAVTRQAEETRVINAARAFAVRRVESTVRQLRRVVAGIPPEHAPYPEYPESARRNGADDADTADAGNTPRRTTSTAVPPAIGPRPDAGSPAPNPEDPRRGADSTQVIGPKDVGPAEPTGPNAQSAPAPQPERPDAATTGRHAGPPGDLDTGATTSGPAADPVEPESDPERLQRLLEFVARQEPGLCWAVGDREDGTTVLVTDLAHGWIPPGVELPAGVRLLEPRRHTGNARALLGTVTISATYAPGDPLGWAADVKATESASQPRELPPVEDLGWVLAEATHWRDGLPRMVHTLAKAGAAGTGVAEPEIDVLRVHLDTARYQLLARYPEGDSVLLLNCLLLAAAEAIATGDRTAANYHFAWFQMLSAPTAGRWAAHP